jgi:hypothetical protein
VRLALEMAGNEASDAQLLRGELQFLMRQWEEADELARLADGLTLEPETDPA